MIDTEPLFYNNNIRTPTSKRIITPRAHFAELLPNISQIKDLTNFVKPGFLNLEQLNELHNVNISARAYQSLLQSIPNNSVNIINSTDSSCTNQDIIVTTFSPNSISSKKPLSEMTSKNFYCTLTKPDLETAQL